MNSATAVSAAAFEARYAGGRDPWSFAEASYELSRYQTLLALLHRSTYDHVYEPGCSVGVLTQRLSRIAHSVLATDFAPSAIAQARRRCADCGNVQFICTDLGRFTPRRPIDLIVFSEIGYYFSEGALAALVTQLVDVLPAGGEFVAGHWLGRSTDHVLHGDRVHEILRGVLRWPPQQRQLHHGFRLESWVKP